jgi:hypothetical protein
VNPIVARSVAAVAVVLGIASIWTERFDVIAPFATPARSYWNFGPHHAIGITALVLSTLTGIGVLLAFALRRPLFDRLWLVSGMALGGLLLLFPIDFEGEAQTPHLKVGGWLGASAFVAFAVAGAVLSLSAAREPERSVAAPAAEPAAPPVGVTAVPATLVPEVVEQRDAVHEIEHGDDDR